MPAPGPAKCHWVMFDCRKRLRGTLIYSHSAMNIARHRNDRHLVIYYESGSFIVRTKSSCDGASNADLWRAGVFKNYPYKSSSFKCSCIIERLSGCRYWLMFYDSSGSVQFDFIPFAFRSKVKLNGEMTKSRLDILKIHRSSGKTWQLESTCAIVCERF